jgi:methylphosphotriester-DNA--protein-cysteine methyltransferase
LDICIEHLPIRPLRPFVESIWYSAATNDTGFEIVPDGCVDACFVLSERRPRILLFGTTTRTSSYELEAGAPYFGVRFRPGKASLFVRESISDLTDAQLAVDEFLGISAEEVLAAGAFAQRRLRLESSLMAALSGSDDQASDVVAHAISEINFSHGDIRVRDLAATCNLSERQLERLFVDRVGLTPKLYARIRRFRSVLDHLEDPADQERLRLADVAASYGYADQSHLMRDFRNFAHELPMTA